MDMHSNIFYQKMDDINEFMKLEKLPSAMQAPSHTRILTCHPSPAACPRL